MFQEKEGRWFWRNVARSDGVKVAGVVGERIERAREVERVNLRLGAEAEEGGALRARYESVLGGMKEIVEGGRKGKGRESKQ